MAPAQQAGVDELEYLEYHDTQENSHKFYQLARKGHLVSFQWGRVGTKGQEQVKEYSGIGRAVTALQDKLSVKRNEGYERETRPSDAPEVPSALTNQASPDGQAAPGAPLEESYLMEWAVDDAHVLDESALQQAWSTARAVLNEAPELGLDVVYVKPHGVTGGHVQFIQKDDRSRTVKAHFGFPPESFLDSLTSRERKAVLELGTSRDGWLSANGKGQGVMFTDKSTLDFAVRLFLSILATRHDVTVSCSDEMEYGTRGLRVAPADHSQFEWYPLWEPVLKPAVAKHWFVEGDSTVIIVDEQDSATPYAW